MISESIQKLEHYLVVVPEKFLQIPSELLLRRPAPGKWSKQEILGHLCDSALNNWQRFATIPGSDSIYEVIPYPQAHLVRQNQYQQQSGAAVTQIWISLNKQILEVMRNLSKEDLQKRIFLPSDGGESDLAFIVNDYVVHLEHHLIQIFGALETLKEKVGWRLTVDEAAKKLSEQGTPRDIVLKERGSLVVEYYAPVGTDPQQPHKQDELYMIISGTGTYYCNGNREAFGPGDVLFAPAGVHHRFEDFTDDLATWVIFYGPKGGENPSDLLFTYSKSIDGKKYEISADPSRFDLAGIYDFLKDSYWAKGRPIEQVKTAIEHSIGFGLFHDGRQIGFARVVSDRSVFAYLADVYVLPNFQGLGLGKWMMEIILNHPALDVEKWSLATLDAHPFYEKFGFTSLSDVKRMMEKKIKSPSTDP